MINVLIIIWVLLFCVVILITLRVSTLFRKKLIVNIGRECALKALKGQSLLYVLRSNKVNVLSLCNGGGTCKKCVCLLKNGNTIPTKIEKKVFSQVELAFGKRLACQVILEDDVTVEL